MRAPAMPAWAIWAADRSWIAVPFGVVTGERVRDTERLGRG